MAAPALSSRFDPLVELYGMWTTELAEHYLPVPGAPPAKYECVDGYLIMSPYEAAPNVVAAIELRTLCKRSARALGLWAYTTLNLRFGEQRWIQPDFAVMRNQVPGVWADVSDAVIVGEFVSPSSRRNDRVDKPRMCAEAGVPYYFYGQVDLRRQRVSLRLDRLVGGAYEKIVEASVGEKFEMTEPFGVSFDPIELLDL